MTSTIPSSTARLVLSPLSTDDIDDVFVVYGDPATWEHLPSGRHTAREQSEALARRHRQSWERAGLGPWAVRISGAGADEDLPAGTFIGAGGVSMTEGGVWNLGYRLTPRSWGRGLATELAEAAVTAAGAALPLVPVTARILSNNRASSVVAQRAGLARRWEGPTTGIGTELARWEIYADRVLTESQLEWLIARN
ncbi:MULTISPECIES: GNAT family N-acetyltransferase [Micrococcaceae]|uniref:GNAT family N-acetyltransferase n=1 Tax=Micrococcaceae TaxID=1268 RepID=UPI00138F58A0